MARNFVAASSQSMDNAAAVVTVVPLTLACWYKPVAVDTFYILVSPAKVDTNFDNFVLYQSSDGTIVAQTTDASSASSAITSSAATAGVWTHTCAVFASSASRAAYINGGSKGTDTGDKTPSGINRTILAARYAGVGTKELFLNGDLAEAAIWNVALDDAEVATLAAGVSPLVVRPSGLVAYWPLIGTTSPEIDIRGRTELTLNNTPTQAAHTRIFYPARPVSIGTAAAAGVVGPLLSGHLIGDGILKGGRLVR